MIKRISIFLAICLMASALSVSAAGYRDYSVTVSPVGRNYSRAETASTPFNAKNSKKIFALPGNNISKSASYKIGGKTYKFSIKAINKNKTKGRQTISYNRCVYDSRRYVKSDNYKGTYCEYLIATMPQIPGYKIHASTAHTKKKLPVKTYWKQQTNMPCKTTEYSEYTNRPSKPTISKSGNNKSFTITIKVPYTETSKKSFDMAIQKQGAKITDKCTLKTITSEGGHVTTAVMKFKYTKVK